jgi:hypothetical protein
MEAIQVSFLREVLEVQRLAFRIEGPQEALIKNSSGRPALRFTLFFKRHLRPERG